MDKLLRLFNVIIPENVKLRMVQIYRKLPFCLPHVILHPTLLCNYRCSYCLYPRYIDKGVNFYKQVFSYTEWLTYFEKFPKATITISGGEPLMYKDLDKLILGLAKKHIISQVVSNISGDLDMLVRAQKAHFRIMASFHNKETTLEEFSKRILYLKKYKFNLIVNYVGTKDNIKEYTYYKNYFEKKLKVFFRMDAYEDLYIQEDDLNMRVHGANYIIKRERFNNYKTKRCSGGQKYFVVMPDASVWRCFSGMMYCNSTDFRKIVNPVDLNKFLVGNLSEKNFKLEKTFFFCHSPCKGVCDIELAAVTVI